MYSFPNLEPVGCSMSGSNCCILTSIQISQEANKVVWYFHLLKIFQFFVIHTVKGFRVANEAEGDIILTYRWNLKKKKKVKLTETGSKVVINGGCCAVLSYSVMSYCL